MSTTKHTPEPWIIAAVNLREPRIEILNAHPPEGEPWTLQATATSEANAQRIVDCVNACEGIENPAQAIESAREILQFFAGYLQEVEEGRYMTMTLSRNLLKDIDARLVALGGQSRDKVKP